MAVDSFVPEIWSAAVLEAFRAETVYTGPGIINRDYEGDIARQGDTVHITSFTDPAVRSYSAHGTVTYDQLSDADTALLIDQSDYFGFKVDDIERAQALPGFIDSASRGAGANLALETDDYVSSIMVTAVDGGANDLGAKTADISDNTLYGHIVSLRTTLVKDNVPANGRWLIVPPEVYAALLTDQRFINASMSADGGAALRNGFVGRIAGFDVYESNTVPTTTPTSTVYRVLAGHPSAVTYAEQIASTETLRLEAQFGDGVRGLHLYGAKVVRPTALAMMDVTVAA